MKMSIVIPCYNEEKNLEMLLKRFWEVLDRENIEVILVDNGSTDGSAELLKSLLPDYEFATCVSVEKNQGYGYGILTGLKAAKGEYIGWTHADLQTDPEDVVKAYYMLEASKQECFIKGKRKGRGVTENIFTIGMGIFESIYLKKSLWDINAQPNIFPRSFFETWEKPPYDFSLDLYAMYMAKRQGVPIKRFPVLFPKRQNGVSHWNTGMAGKWKFIGRTIQFSRKLKKRGIA